MTHIAVIGLGYVGLPLAIEFGKHFKTTGYDISTSKIEAYKNHVDPSGEVESSAFALSTNFNPTTDIAEIRDADFIIIAMPTPVDHNNIPDFECLITASAIVGQNMKAGSTIIYESTVYPGATEEICIPVLENHSGLTWQHTFNVGYSPERISPADKVMTLTKLCKVVSGDTTKSLEAIASLYEVIIEAGVYRASSIRVAEAAKVVENIQRDVNIALMNELSVIFSKLKLDTNDVIDAAASKWNFANYRPGLVGGHCIGVDPYYLIHKAHSVGHISTMLSGARTINNRMMEFVVKETLKDFTDSSKLTVGILGYTFKENCTDLRNSKVFDLADEYRSKVADVYLFDPLVDDSRTLADLPKCDVLVLAVPHQILLEMDVKSFIEKLNDGGVMVDIKGKLDRNAFVDSGKKLWRM
jgi:UDP-N-acetyl-D-galactosamine dehydrogenase